MKKFFYGLLIGGWCLGIMIPVSAYNAEIVVLKFAMALLWWGCLYVGLCLDRKLFSPFTLFCSYPFCLMLYSDYVSKKYLPLPTADGVAVLILAGASTFMGMLVMRSWAKQSAPVYAETAVTPPKMDYKTWPLLACFVIPFSMVLLSSNSLDLDYSSRESVIEIRERSGIAVWGTFLAFYVPTIVNVIRKRQYKTLALMTMMIFIMSLFNLSKGTIINWMLVIAFAWEKYRDEKSITRIRYYFLGAAALVVLMFAFNFYGELRSGQYRSDRYLTSYEYALRYHHIQQLPKGLQGLYAQYMYMTTPSSNVAYLVENKVNDGNFVTTFWPVLSTFQLKRIFNIRPPLLPIRIMPYNTFSLGGAFYSDGGWPVVMIGCFVLGFLTYWFYARSRGNPDAIIAAEYFFWGQAMFYAFFSNHFVTQCYPLRMLIILEIYRGLCLLSHHNSESSSQPGKIF